MGRNTPKHKGRNGEIRNVKRNVADNYISFSFRYFEDSDIPPASSLQTWDSDDTLLDILRALVHLSKCDITQLQSSKRITLYGKFPPKSLNDFPPPTGLSKDENWGTLRNIGGQRARIAGFLKDNIFYIVYLDKEHKFYKSNH
ncbi:hypothetical protein [Peptostreptococcus porci]|uniref:hypothetical protein n=1 Tax=Peptostreptococcus porci TaxID=2652282 RepID=UPI002A918AD8|nr:hypothetical protein [Peptostreptococcus porci]MDY5436768.1 hypothetical protein [Peptostreptococcus porci]